MGELTWECFCYLADVEPTFPYREINTRRGVKIKEAYEILDEIGR